MPHESTVNPEEPFTDLASHRINRATSNLKNSSDYEILNLNGK